MKKIKLRAWHKADEKMYDVYGFSSGEWFLKNKTFPMPLGAVEIMQYTGLKDKNGEEICEGDVFKKPTEINKELHGEFAYYEVINKDGILISSYVASEKGRLLPKGYLRGFLLDSFEFSQKSFLFNDNCNLETEIEVVGNIYENPELLGESNA